ncbi:NupC/NupG family nucleoside CNT transporter [Lichenicoccus sp.]|uniref:NupC/NupG family nucleoside CNT transporter n=1 Tax=Lichenicoccus sp. TaxID=2781899 RepID=UPI003D096D27
MPQLEVALHGVAGLAALVAIALVCSLDRRRIRLRTVGAALALQFAIGALILFVPVGRHALHAISLVVNQVLGYGNDGIEFLFGGLVGPRMFTVFPDGGFVFALRVLPQIIYISALIAVLYYFHVMQFMARILGGAVRAVVGTSAIESFSAVTTIFLGQSEMPVAIRPFVALLTRAELFAVMSSGTASVAGSVLAGYAGLGVPIDYLLAASFMAIPGGLLFAKLLLPTTEASPVTTMDLEFEERRPANVFEAVAIGTTNGVRVAVAVGSMLVAFIGLIACLNGLVGWIGGLAGHPALSLEAMLGWLFAPLAWLIGVRPDLCVLVGGIIGQKIVFNEFVAYVHLSPLIHARTLDPRSLAIVSFALCGFANFSSIGILLAGFGSVAPERRAEVSRLGLRAVLAGTLSNLASATIAGMFIS